MSALILYASPSGMTENIAQRLAEMLGPDDIVLIDIEEWKAVSVRSFDLLIFGISTWGIGAMPDEWQDFLSELDAMDLQGKKVALFGLGDQESYPYTFCDAMGFLFDFLREKKCNLTGEVPSDGYKFEKSFALREGRFVGLPLDEVNQPEKTEERLRSWLKTILN